MLVLTRKVGEKILVGDNIVITVVRVMPNAVRIGIQAPHGVNIVREELIEQTDQYIEVDIPLDDVTVPGGSGHAIQASEPDVADLGRRRSEFLESDEVAEAYVEATMIDHGC